MSVADAFDAMTTNRVYKSKKTISEAVKKAKVSFETLQAHQNAMSKEFGAYKREGKDTSELKARVDANKIVINEALDIQRDAIEVLEKLAMAIPNMPDDEVPDGEDENDNKEIKKVLTPKEFSFTPKEHWELAEQNGWIDFERGVKLATSRFSVSFGMGASLITILLASTRAFSSDVSLPSRLYAPNSLLIAF
jgi:seryl-tRNA synthetase